MKNIFIQGGASPSSCWNTFFSSFLGKNWLYQNTFRPLGQQRYHTETETWVTPLIHSSAIRRPAVHLHPNWQNKKDWDPMWRIHSDYVISTKEKKEKTWTLSYKHNLAQEQNYLRRIKKRGLFHQAYVFYLWWPLQRLSHLCPVKHNFIIKTTPTFKSTWEGWSSKDVGAPINLGHGVKCHYFQLTLKKDLGKASLRAILHVNHSLWRKWLPGAERY